MVGPTSCDGALTYQDGELNTYRFTPGVHQNQRQYYSPPPGVGATLYRDDATGQLILRDDRNVTSEFDTHDLLAAVSDDAGNRITVSWASVPNVQMFVPKQWVGRAGWVGKTEYRVTQVVDTTGRTIHFNYDPVAADANPFLQCVSLTPDCGSPLVSFGIPWDRTLTTVGELTWAKDADGYMTSYSYFHQIVPVKYLQTATLGKRCHQLCSPASEDCHNIDICNSYGTYCNAIPPAPPDYKVTPECVGYSQMACDREAALNQGQESYCINGLYGLENQFCHDDIFVAAQQNQCLGELATEYDFCCYSGGPCKFADSNRSCMDGCLAQYQAHNEAGNARYAFGQPNDLNHNLIQITDPLGRIVLTNVYGPDPFNVNFDKVTDQYVGSGTNTHYHFEYHDLAVEALYPYGYPVGNGGGPAPSPPNPGAVIPAAQFVSVALCPGACTYLNHFPWVDCSHVTFTAPFNDSSGATPSQVPVTAVVITDPYGFVRTQYFDDRGEMLREINLSNREITDYNYSNDFIVGVRKPAGDRNCSVLDPLGRPTEVALLPSQGYPGDQTQHTTTYSYDANGVLSDVIRDWGVDPARTHFGYDASNRLSSIVEDADGARSRTTILGYVANTWPTSVTKPDLSKTLLLDYDPIGAAPRTIQVFSAANGTALFTLSRTFDSATGAVLQQGRPSLYQEMRVVDTAMRPKSISRQIDANSPWQVSNYGYDGAGMPQMIVGPRSSRYLQLDQNANPTLTIDYSTLPGDTAAAKATCMNYMADGRLVQQVLPEGNSILFNYDANGRVYSVLKGYTPLTEPWSVLCQGTPPTDDQGLQEVSHTDFVNNGFIGGMTRNGIHVDFTTDGFGRVIEIRDSEERLTRRGFDSRDRIVWEAHYGNASGAPPYGMPSQGDGFSMVTQYAYDHFDRPTSISRWFQSGPPLVTGVAYDEVAHTVTVTDAAGRQTVDTFDELGRHVSRKYPDASATTVTTTWAPSGNSATRTIHLTNTTLLLSDAYDGLGLLSQTLDNTGAVLFSESHDIDGNPLTRSTAESGNESFGYDGFNRVVSRTRVLSSGSASSSISWDRNDRVVGETAPGAYRSTSFIFDGIDRVLHRVDPLGRMDTRLYTGALLQPFLNTDASGTNQTFAFDGTGAVKYEWTSPASGLEPYFTTRSFTYDALGRIQTAYINKRGAPHPDVFVSLSYDEMGRSTYEYSSLAMTSLNSQYDPLGNWESLSLASASIVRNVDSLGRLSSVNVNGTTLASYYYGSGGLGDALQVNYWNGASSVISHDGRGRRNGIDVVFGEEGMLLASAHDGLGLDGMPRQRQRQFGSAATLTDVYQVDSHGRLTAENSGLTGQQLASGDLTNDTVAAQIHAGTAWRSYALDGRGNWNNRVDGSGAGFTATVDNLDRYLSVNSVPTTYDPADNMTQVGSGSYTFDFMKNVVRATGSGGGTSYVYDALGRRVLETNDDGSTNYLVWSGAALVASGSSTYDQSSFILHVPGAGLDEHVASIPQLGQGIAQYHHQSADGSTLAVTGSTGLVEGYSYSAFGETRVVDGNGVQIAASAIGNRFLFQGALFDAVTQTYSMRAREYHPQLGRFLSTDPIGLAGGENLYAFTEGRPLGFRDPFGTCSQGAASPIGEGNPTSPTGENGIRSSYDSGNGVSAPERSQFSFDYAPTPPTVTVVPQPWRVNTPVVSGVVIKVIGTQPLGFVVSNDDVAVMIGGGIRAAIPARTTGITPSPFSPIDVLAGMAAARITGGVFLAVRAGAAAESEGVSFAASDARLFQLLRSSLASQEIIGAKAVGSALKSDVYHVAPSWVTSDIAANAQVFTIGSRTGSATLTQMPGTVNDVAGRFEWIVDSSGNLTHQLFVPLGAINGVPIVP